MAAAAEATAGLVRTRCNRVIQGGLLAAGAAMLEIPAGAGLILAFSSRVDAFVDATTYAIAVGLVGLLNVAGGVWPLSRAS